MQAASLDLPFIIFKRLLQQLHNSQQRVLVFVVHRVAVYRVNTARHITPSDQLYIDTSMSEQAQKLILHVYTLQLNQT